MAPIHDNGYAVADAAGVATVEFNPAFDEDWYVGRIYFSTDGALAPTVKVYVGGVGEANVKDIATGFTAIVSDESTTVYVPGGSVLIVEATGATPGSNLTVNIQYQPESFAAVGAELLAELLNSGAGVDGQLFERGFPNQVQRPRARR